LRKPYQAYIFEDVFVLGRRDWGDLENFYISRDPHFIE